MSFSQNPPSCFLYLFRFNLRPCPRILAEFYFLQITQISEHIVVDVAKLVVVDVKVLQIVEHLKDRVIDPLNEIERQVQGLQGVLHVHEPISRHNCQFIAPKQQLFQLRETDECLCVARLYARFVEVQRHESRPESRETVPFERSEKSGITSKTRENSHRRAEARAIYSIRID